MTLNGGGGSDTVTGFGDVNFTLTNTSLIGLGTDTLTSIERAFLSGGAGNNTIDASAFALGPVNLFGGFASGGGTGGNDTLIGGTRDDLLAGGGGSDILQGREGNDALLGEAGADSLDGGPGTDGCDVDATDTSRVNCEANASTGF